MVARAILLAEDEDDYIESVVAGGAYPSADAALTDAVRALRDKREEAWLSSPEFLALVDEGIADFEAGRFETVPMDQLGAWMDGLIAESSA